MRVYYCQLPDDGHRLYAMVTYGTKWATLMELSTLRSKRVPRETFDYCMIQEVTAKRMLGRIRRNIIKRRKSFKAMGVPMTKSAVQRVLGEKT